MPHATSSVDPAPEPLQARDYPELIAFLNRCFGFPAERGFTDLLPVIYQPVDAVMQQTWALRQQDRKGARIVAAIGIFPIRWHLGAEVLRVAGIGGVAVDPDCRGGRLMERMMHLADQVIAAGDYDLSYLDGLRQRYQRYGWEAGGTQLRFRLDRHNLQHAWPPAADRAVHWAPADLADPAMLGQLHHLHAQQPNRVERPWAALPLILRNWRLTTWVARSAAGRLLGYAVGNDARDEIVELVAGDPADLEAMIAGLSTWLPEGTKALSLVTSGEALPIQQRLAATAQEVQLERNGNWRLYRWPRVLSVLMAWRGRQQRLSDGAARLRIEDQRLAITVRDGQPQVTALAPEAGPSEELNLTHHQAVRLFFGPVAVPLGPGLPPSAAALAHWCPLPLYLSRPDHV